MTEIPADDFGKLIERLNVRPGDRFVIHADRHLSRDMFEILQDTFKKFAGDEASLLILDRGLTLSLLRHGSDAQPPQTHLEGRPEQVQAAFEVFAGKADTGPSATAIFRYIESLEKEAKDLKHDLASARHVAKNAASNEEYWRRQYEALTATAPTSNVAAWMHRQDDGSIVATGIPRVAEIWREQGCNVLPLYEHPPQDHTVVSLRDELEVAADRLDQISLDPFLGRERCAEIAEWSRDARAALSTPNSGETR